MSLAVLLASSSSACCLAALLRYGDQAGWAFFCVCVLTSSGPLVDSGSISPRGSHGVVVCVGVLYGKVLIHLVSHISSVFCPPPSPGALHPHVYADSERYVSIIEIVHTYVSIRFSCLSVSYRTRFCSTSVSYRNRSIVRYRYRIGIDLSFVVGIVSESIYRSISTTYSSCTYE